MQENDTLVTKPNVLIIVTDQQSYNMMSFTGNNYLSTPNMDGLAKRGYSFSKTYTTNPVCQPSRFSILTGHYTSSVGIKENYRTVRRPRYQQYNDYIQKGYSFDTAQAVKMKSQSLGQIFSKAGYDTYYSGKKHFLPDGQGWGFTTLAKDPYDGSAQAAEDFFSDRSSTKQVKPFLFYVSFMQPHDICYEGYLPDDQDPEEIRRLRMVQEKMNRSEYLKQLPPRKSMEPIQGENPDMFNFVSQHRHWSAEEWDLYRWLYYRLTETADQQVGRVLSALEKSGLDENTIVVLTSDHGDMQGAHGLVWKNVLLEEAQRVPFIFAGPGIKQNQIDASTLVCNGLDLLPTICDLTGVNKPNGLPGISLKHYLTGSGKDPNRKHIFTESYNAFQIIEGSYKYTVYELPGHPEMLADLEVDPEENINFADNSNYSIIKSDLKDKLFDYLTDHQLTPLPVDREMKYLTPTRVK